MTIDESNGSKMNITVNDKHRNIWSENSYLASLLSIRLITMSQSIARPFVLVGGKRPRSITLSEAARPRKNRWRYPCERYIVDTPVHNNQGSMEATIVGRQR
ncbi:hypothetical protein [Pseudomonas sp. MWU16-30317]|uniref:hypothetical protein n=1 Tax=Pseudomonas sp. MWU16-30317 TaxID=2878095 RepID=UPI001CFAFBD6|nr:hypothetical protein [Pseudomonas sp. MWU16-30317]